MKKILIILLMFTSFCTNANQLNRDKADDNFFAEVWDCGGYSSASNRILAFIYRGRKTGGIRTQNIKHTATFYVTGLSRRWDFGGVNKNDYSFIIGHDGYGSYYDFSLKSKNIPESVLKCAMRTQTHNTKGKPK